jgi:hypothetical protein
LGNIEKVTKVMKFKGIAIYRGAIKEGVYIIPLCGIVEHPKELE